MTITVSVGSVAPDFVYTSMQGEQKHLAQLWAEGPALVLWLRHFG
jgi:hypothetical protein